MGRRSRSEWVPGGSSSRPGKGDGRRRGSRSGRLPGRGPGSLVHQTSPSPPGKSVTPTGPGTGSLPTGVELHGRPPPSTGPRTEGGPVGRSDLPTKTKTLVTKHVVPRTRGSTRGVVRAVVPRGPSPSLGKREVCFSGTRSRVGLWGLGLSDTPPTPKGGRPLVVSSSWRGPTRCSTSHFFSGTGRPRAFLCVVDPTRLLDLPSSHPRTDPMSRKVVVEEDICP